MNQKNLLILTIILVLLTVAYIYTYFYSPMRETETTTGTTANPQLIFSYAKAPGYETKADPESTTQNWEGNKLRVVANKVANLCAKKTSDYEVKGDSIVLKITEELKSVCDGFDLFGFNFLVGPLEKQDYKVSVIFIRE